MSRAFGTNLTNVLEQNVILVKPRPVFVQQTYYSHVLPATSHVLQVSNENQEKRKSLQLKNRPNILKRKRISSGSLNLTPTEVSVNSTPVMADKIKVEYEPAKKRKSQRDDKNPYEKPPYSYMAMIQFAIESAGPSRKMTLKDIYDYIETKFPYFKHAKPGWKNSVRHNLSLHPIFFREPSSNPKVSFWCMKATNEERRLDDYDENGRRKPERRPRKEPHPPVRKISDDFKENIPPAGYQPLPNHRLSDHENPEIVLHPVESPIRAVNGVTQDSFEAIVDRFIAADGRCDVSIGHDSFNRFIDELGSPFTTSLLHSNRQSEKKKRPLCSSTPAIARSKTKKARVRRAIAGELDRVAKPDNKENLGEFEELEDLFEILD